MKGVLALGAVLMLGGCASQGRLSHVGDGGDLRIPPSSVLALEPLPDSQQGNALTAALSEALARAGNEAWAVITPLLPTN